MAGLTQEEMGDLLARPSPEAQPGSLGFPRADAIRAEIYKRHGIDPSRSLDEAIDRINVHAQLRRSVGNDGGELSAWANPEEREQGRAEYAAEGKTPQEVKARMDASIHLLDPRSQQYMQDFGRDLDFLGSELESQKQSQSLRTPRRILDANAIRHYDSNAGERLARGGGVYGEPMSAPQGGYQRFSGWGSAAMNAVSNPETPSGSYLTWAEIPAEAILTAWSGEANTSREAWDRARANHAANVNYKIGTPTPVADLPAGSTPSGQQIADRIRELQERVTSAGTPMAAERWYRTTGYAPPGWITDPGESVVRAIDPSMLIPVGMGAAALKTAGRAAVRPIAAGFARDMGQEQAFDLGLQGALGGEPGRSNRQFWLGGGKPGADFMYKSPEELEQTRQDAAQLNRDLRGSERLSTAKDEAYHGIAESGALGPNAQMRSRMARKLRQ